MPDQQGIRGRPYEMSRFHCQEMLYDYMSGRLDEQRRAAIEKRIESDKELKAELDMYVDAAHYCEKLSQVALADPTISELESIRLQTEIVADKVRYRNWPDLLKWSSEAILISVFVAGLAMVIPWGTIRGVFKNPPHNEVILADIEKPKENGSVPVTEPPIGSKVKPEAAAVVAQKPAELPKVEDKKIPAIAAIPIAPPPAAPVVVAPPNMPPPTQVIPQPEPLALPVAANTEPPKGRLVEKQIGTQNTIKPGPKGMLTRIMMNKTDIESLAPQLRDKIIALGGAKAGEVEIGWRQPGQNYFHFSIPEANYQKLLSILGGLGSSRVYKSPHDRVMPEGTMRIILTIKDGGESKPAVSSGSAFGEEGALESPYSNTPADSTQPPESTTDTGE